MKYEDLLNRAIEIRSKYDELNKTKRNVEWNEQQLMAGFVGDVGDLSKNYHGKAWVARYGGRRY